MDNKKILITSALPYVNNVPHLGNIIGCVLSADVFARFCRSMGKETLYICGADEHGTATETKAKEEGLTPKQLCDKYYDIHKNIYEWFNISFDIFGRTSTENHKKITQELFSKVLENGFVEEDTVTQPYSVKSEMFLADRFIVGTCPHCDYEKARGDQCDSCGKLLNPSELVNPKSAIDGSTPEFRETEHLFLNLNKLQPLLQSWVKKQSKDGFWTQNAIRTTNAWFKEGLKKRAITRDLKWGINIPESAFGGRYKDKVFYVWFDAPIGYISITQQLLGEKYKEWWCAPNDVSLYQFMGKDNIPFHSIIFPGSLMAAEDAKVIGGEVSTNDYTLVHHLSVTEYLNYEHTKFSKSNGVGVFGDNAKDSGIPSDVFRYVLLYNRPENSDTQFTWKGLQERLNNELVANFGNLVNRTTSFISRFLEGKVEPIAESDLDVSEKEFYEKYKEEVKHYINLLENVKLRDALMQFMKISSIGNQYFQDNEPWKTKTVNRNKCQRDLALLANMVYDLAALLEPYLPDTAANIFKQLNVKPKTISGVCKLSLGDHKLGEPEILFQKLEDKDVEILREKYGGSQEKEEVEVEENKSLQPEDVHLRVGKIIEVTKHPKADKLYIEKVDLGDKEIEIVSGLVGYYIAEELLGKHIIVVTNLKPAKLRGVMSNGMLLAGEDDKGTVGLVFAPNAKPGEKVRTDKQGTPKEEISFDEFMTLKFEVKDGVPLLNGMKLKAKDSPIVVDKVANGVIR